MESEKLGTCDHWHYLNPHPHYSNCVNWREQPQGEATSCPDWGDDLRYSQSGKFWYCSNKQCDYCSQARCQHKSFLWDGNENHPHQCEQCGCLFSKAQVDSMAHTEGGEKPKSPCCHLIMRDDTAFYTCSCGRHWIPVELSLPTKWREIESASPPAQPAGGAIEFVVEWVKQCKKTCLRVEDIAACAETYADQRVRPLQTSLAKLYAAIGPMDELDTVDDAVARVEKLRQERDAAKKEITRLILQYTVSHDYWYDGDAHFDSPEEYADEQNLTVGEEFELTASSYWEEKFRVTKVPDEKNDDYECETISKQREEFETYQQMAEARERAEKALREFGQHHCNCNQAEVNSGCTCGFERVLASLKSSEGAK